MGIMLSSEADYEHMLKLAPNMQYAFESVDALLFWKFVRSCGARSMRRKKVLQKA
jgi:hypothetical protein